MRRVLTCSVFVIALTANGAAQASDAGTDGGSLTAAPSDSKREKIRVGVAGSPPFVISKDDKIRGFSMDVWQAIAERLGVEYEVVRYSSVSDALAAVGRGEVRIAVGPISITAARRRVVEFTQPYFNAELGILVGSRATSKWEGAKPFLGRAFLFAVGSIMFLLLVVGNLIWLVERKANKEQFPQRYWKGVGNGMWFALVTATTVGYGDRYPRTTAGRFITGAWMLVALFAASSVTAGITTGLTLSQIEDRSITDLASLEKRRVVTVAGTPGELVARRHRMRSVVVAGKEEAFTMVSKGKAEAFLYDYPVLRYHLDQHVELDFEVYDTGSRTDDYGFATAPGDVLNDAVDLALLRLRETRIIMDLESRWLSP